MLLGAWSFRKDSTAVLNDPASALTALAIDLFRSLLDQVRELNGWIATLDHRIVQFCRASLVSARPGQGLTQSSRPPKGLVGAAEV